jgi:tetratricopeptide (TPR) repeat protein
MQMEKLFFSLESCDYRIHAFITKSLAAMADGQGCTTCAQNAALQLLFCNAIGFGLDLDQEQTNHYLGKSGKDISTVQQTIQRIKNDNKKTDTIMAILAQQGYRHDFPTTYDRDGVLKDAIEYYRRALAKRKSLFDPGHFTMLRLQGLLVGLLRQNDRFEEAMEVALEMDIIADRLNTVDQLEIKTDLARLHLSLGNVEEAVALNRQVAEIHATFSKRDKTTERLDNQRHLAKALIKQGDFKAAISRASDTLRDCLKELGELHTSTIGVQRCLAEAYSAAGEIELAVKTRKDLVQAEDRLVSKESIDPKFVQDICILGVQCYRTNDLDSAKECYGKVHLLIRRDKRLATHAVDAVSNCAFERIRQDDNETALIILEKLLPETTKVVGTHCPEAALVMGNLAWLYSQQGDHNRAEAFQRQVLEVRQETLGRSHVHTITAMGDLRVTLLAQGQHDEAFILGEQEIEAVAGRSNASVSDIVEAAETVAGTLESAGAYAQAIRFFETEARLTGVDTMSMSVTSLPSMARAAHCYFHLGDLVKARQMTIAVLSRAPQSSSKELANLFSYLLPLAMEFLDRGCLPESEQILAMAAILQQQGLSAEATESSNLETLIERYLGLRQIDSFEVTFDPSKLVQ